MSLSFRIFVCWIFGCFLSSREWVSHNCWISSSILSAFFASICLSFASIYLSFVCAQCCAMLCCRQPESCLKGWGVDQSAILGAPVAEMRHSQTGVPYTSYHDCLHYLIYHDHNYILVPNEVRVHRFSLPAWLEKSRPSYVFRKHALIGFSAKPTQDDSDNWRRPPTC